MKENIVEFPDRKSVQEEAALWLIKLDGDEEPTPEMLASLHEWLARNPVHRQELHGLALTWSRMNVLTELAVPLGRMDEQEEPLFASRFMRRWGIRHRSVLASLLVGAIIYAIYAGIAGWRATDRYLASNGTYVTRVGEQKMATLSDGSIILLNTNSEVRVDYSENFRDTRLVRGEAEFTVAKNPNQPFRVYAGNERVQAIGTAFTVFLQNDKVDVMVTEGEVALATRSEDAPENGAAAEPSATTAATPIEYVETLSTLKAGQSARMSAADKPADNPLSAPDAIEVIEADHLMTRRLAWREGLLIFDGDPLEDVVREISRYTTVAIEITDPLVGATRIGGQFPVGETDAMLDVLESSFGFQVTRLGTDRVLISAAAN